MKTLNSTGIRQALPAGNFRREFGPPSTSMASLLGWIVPGCPSWLRRAFIVPVLALIAPLAHGQWQNVTYSLRGGWNSIYLHGDASYTSIDQLFANNSEIVAVWRWNPNPSQTQFSTSTLVPSSGTPEWSTWKRGATGNTLLSLSGPSAYMVECSGTAATTTSVVIPQKAQPPRLAWVRNGANLLGFPAATGTSAPTLAAYFASFPLAIATSSKIYKYAGGPLGTSNPVQIFSTSSETLDRTQAYWFEAAPLRARPPPPPLPPHPPVRSRSRARCR